VQTILGLSGVTLGNMTVPEEMMLYNFTSPSFTDLEANTWYESSDTVRTAGMSKASFCLQKSRQFQRAVMFAMINPQPNGAGFAGMKHEHPIRSSHLAASPEGIILRLRGQGQLPHWKVVLTDSDQLGLTSVYTYEHKFTLEKMEERQFEEVRLPLSSFHAYYRGQEVDSAPALDLAKVTLHLLH